MFSAEYLCICIYCMLQLGFLFIIEIRNTQTKHEIHYLIMLIIAFFSFIADIMSSIYGGSGWFFPFAAAGNYIEIILSTALIPIYFNYICEQINDIDPSTKRRLNCILWVMGLICAAVVLSTAFTGQIFYFDESRIYHRGPLFFIPMLILLVMMIIVEIFLISQRKKIEANYYKSLLIFIIIPIIGWALQLFIYGLPFSLLGLTFAALILFTNIQNRNMDKDYLTGAFNRKTLDNYVQHMIDISSDQKSFSAILIDLDNFKSTNDTYGHFEGDLALKNAVHLLRDSVRHNDFIARYGGDEFYIIIDNDNQTIIDAIITRIYSNLSDFNKKQDKLYKLSFSMGYSIYGNSVGDKPESFYKIIDKKMYEDKFANARNRL